MAIEVQVRDQRTGQWETRQEFEEKYEVVPKGKLWGFIPRLPEYKTIVSRDECIEAAVAAAKMPHGAGDEVRVVDDEGCEYCVLWEAGHWYDDEYWHEVPG